MLPHNEEVGYSDGGYFRHFVDTSSGLLFEFWKDKVEFGVRFLCDSELKVKLQLFYKKILSLCCGAEYLLSLFGEA
jgi:hypothetical protein